MTSEVIQGDILVVDDSLANLELLMAVLMDGGHQVFTANSGSRALDAIKTRLPDLILLDIGMPDIDGYEVCRRLKADPAVKNIPVIFLSAFGDIKDKQKGFEVGGVDYVTKPFIPDEVLFRVQAHIKLNRMRVQLQQQTVELMSSKGQLERSIVELKSSHKALVQSEKLASLGRLIAEIAHEVNNPLMIISGNAQLCLMTEEVTGEVKNTLDIVVDECKRAKGILNRVLRFARPSKGEIKQVNPQLSIEAVVGILEKQFILNNNIHIVRHYTSEPCFINVDEPQVQEVFMNLLNNAKEAMLDGGTITITTFIEGKLLNISFADTGSGMTEDVMQKMFEPFFTTKENGGGIGLGICYAIIKDHNGELKFESAVGKGTVATIVLPVGTISNG
ncbi:MAG: response regulator [Candidatus Omnitrophica bacterium]|nr:response regulator [Candidatus Omnitrophota bacterium]